jgi:hypothetical protein
VSKPVSQYMLSRLNMSSASSPRAPSPPVCVSDVLQSGVS